MTIVAGLVQLHTRAVELVFERGVGNVGKRLVDVVGRIGEHRADRLQNLDDNRIQRGRASGQRGLRGGRQIAGHQHCPTHLGGRDGRGPGDRVEDDALEGALAELAVEDLPEELLFVARRARQQRRQLLHPRPGGPGAFDFRQRREGRVDVSDGQRRLVGRPDIGHGRDGRVAETEPALTRLSGKQRDDGCDLIGGKRAKQIGEMRDLGEAS